VTNHRRASARRAALWRVKNSCFVTPVPLLNYSRRFPRFAVSYSIFLQEPDDSQPQPVICRIFRFGLPINKYNNDPMKWKNTIARTQPVFSPSVSPLFWIAETSIQIQNAHRQMQSGTTHNSTNNISIPPNMVFLSF
jgi:hypothetical protein